MIFDELAQQYFSSPEEFAAALKLLQRCNAAETNHPDYADFEAKFLDNLDDVTGCETWLLHKAFDYDAATKIAAGATPTLSAESEFKILEAIRNQHKAHINSIPLRQAFDAFITTPRSKIGETAITNSTIGGTSLRCFTNWWVTLKPET